MELRNLNEILSDTKSRKDSDGDSGVATTGDDNKTFINESTTSHENQQARDTGTSTIIVACVGNQINDTVTESDEEEEPG